MGRWQFAVLLGLALSVAAGAHAGEVTVEQYRHPKSEDYRAMNRLYLSGVVSGLEWYNGYLTTDHADAVAFCQPGKLALTVDQAADIMLRWANKRRETTKDMAVSFALLNALQDTFPCNR